MQLRLPQQLPAAKLQFAGTNEGSWGYICRLALFFLCVTGLVSLHAQQNFSVQLSQGGLTSAGIFDANGRIVRTLWALETFNSGNLNCSWDGRDDFGTPVPPGSYTWKSFATAPNIITSGDWQYRAAADYFRARALFD